MNDVVHHFVHYAGYMLFRISMSRTLKYITTQTMEKRQLKK